MDPSLAGLASIHGVHCKHRLEVRSMPRPRRGQRSGHMAEGQGMVGGSNGETSSGLIPFLCPQRSQLHCGIYRKARLELDDQFLVVPPGRSLAQWSPSGPIGVKPSISNLYITTPFAHLSLYVTVNMVAYGSIVCVGVCMCM